MLIENHDSVYGIRRTSKRLEPCLRRSKPSWFDRAAADASATRVGSTPRPLPRSGEIAIAVRYAGINFKDVMSRRGDPGYVKQWPFIPGLEAAGTVIELGESVEDLTVGDPVVALTNQGGLAEVAIAPAALTVPVPATVGLGLAAAAPGALVTADLLLNLAHLTPGDSLLSTPPPGRSDTPSCSSRDAVERPGSSGQSEMLSAAKVLSTTATTTSSCAANSFPPSSR